MSEYILTSKQKVRGICVRDDPHHGRLCLCTLQPLGLDVSTLIPHVGMHKAQLAIGYTRLLNHHI